MMSNDKKSKRLQIDLTPESHERLQFLKQNTECTSFAEVTGRAYTIFELSVKLHLKYKFDYRSRKIIVKLNPKDSSKSYIYGLTKFLENLKDISVYKD